MSPLAAAGLAALGAFAVEFLLYVAPFRFGGWPSYTKQVGYWVTVCIGAGIGAGIAAFAASDGDLPWYVVLNIGASWPIIIQQAAKQSPYPQTSNVN